MKPALIYVSRWLYDSTFIYTYESNDSEINQFKEHSEKQNLRIYTHFSKYHPLTKMLWT